MARRYKEHVVYRLTSPSSKVYIGETVNFERRMYRHNYNALNSNMVEYNSYLSKAIRKYGWDNFTKEILVSEIPTKIIREVETCFIRYYKYYLKKKVYNLRDVSDAKKHSKESIKKMSLNGSGRGKLGVLNPTSRAIMQINPITGNIVKRWDSINDVERELNINSKHISSVCRRQDRRKKAGGFIWIYEEEYSTDVVIGRIKRLTEPVNQGKCKSVLQINKATGEIIKEWDSATEAGQELGIKQSRISSCCIGNSFVANGFIWMFKNEYSKEAVKKKIKAEKVKYKHSCKPVRQIDTVTNKVIKEWESVIEASRVLKLSRACVGRACVGKYSHAYGFKWEYV